MFSRSDSGSSTAAAEPAGGSTGPVYPATWSRRAEELNADPGEVKEFECPVGGELHPQLYGTGVYSSDTSICTAAVHAGLITLERGGVVAIEYLPGQESYVGSTHGGVTSKSYGEWQGSFRFPASDLQEPEAAAAPAAMATSASTDGQQGPPTESTEADSGSVYPATWARRAEELNASPGERKRFRCPAQGEAHPQLFGTDVYSSDTSVCTAGVHAGLITLESGGVVEVEYVEGQAAYMGSTRNGVTSKDYGEWRGSFRFPNVN